MDYMRHCLDVKQFRKATEYTNINVAQLSGILYYERSPDHLCELHRQINSRPPRLLTHNNILDDLCKNLLPEAAIHSSLDLIKYQITGERPVGLVLTNLEEEFWQFIASTPFGMLIHFAKAEQSTMLLLLQEMEPYLYQISDDMFQEACSELFCWFIQSFLSGQQGPFAWIGEFAETVDNITGEDVPTMLRWLDIAKSRIQEACIIRSNHSWMRICNWIDYTSELWVIPEDDEESS